MSCVVVLCSAEWCDFTRICTEVHVLFADVARYSRQRAYFPDGSSIPAFRFTIGTRRRYSVGDCFRAVLLAGD